MPFEKGKEKTGGRKKGVKNKLPSTVKENIEKVVEELGGWEGIKQWAEKNQRNQGLLYGWYFKMLPTSLVGEQDDKGEFKPLKVIVTSDGNNPDNTP